LGGEQGLTEGAVGRVFSGVKKQDGGVGRYGKLRRLLQKEVELQGSGRHQERNGTTQSTVNTPTPRLDKSVKTKHVKGGKWGRLEDPGRRRGETLR